MVLTVSSVLSPVTGLVCHRRLQGRTRKLDASVGASGPHGFAVRSQHLASADATASTASRPTVVTTRDRPSLGMGCFGYRGDLHFGKTEIFFARGLDRPNQLEMAQQIGIYRAVRFRGIGLFETLPARIS